MIWSLIVGAFIGMIAGKMTEKSQSMGCFTNIIAGLIGSAVGQRLFGDWGIQLQVWLFSRPFWEQQL